MAYSTIGGDPFSWQAPPTIPPPGSAPGPGMPGSEQTARSGAPQTQHMAPTATMSQPGDPLRGGTRPNRGQTIQGQGPWAGATRAAGYGPPPTPPTGTESGPGILENWFNQRVQGVDQAYNYGMQRGGDDIDRRMAAGGSFNSGARGQQLGDFAANMGAQRQQQLDALAAGASGEHRGRLQDMFSQMFGLAGGQAGVGGAYDLKGADSLNAANQAILSMFLNKAGVDSQSNAQGIGNITKLVGLGG